MRKLLTITYHFPPSAASGTFRLLGFARHLPSCGWQPIVVAPPRLPWEPTDAGLIRQMPPETIVRAVPYPRSACSKPIRWLFPNAIWLEGARRACLRLVEEYRPDALLTSSPPHCVHLLGRYLQRRSGLPWVADFRDLWFIDGRPAFGQPRFPRLEAKGERMVMLRADVVVANAPGAAESMRRAYPEQRHKIAVLTNGFDPESVPRENKDRFSQHPIQIIHTGELYAGRDPRPFLDAVKSLDGQRSGVRQSVRVVFVGRSRDVGFDLTEGIRDRRLQDDVVMMDQVSYDDGLRMMAQADFLLLLDSPGRRIGIPAKLYEYFGAGRPILALAEPDGDVAWALRTSGITHWLAPPNDSVRIARALRQMVESSHRSVAVTTPNVKRFTRASIAQELASLLDECFANGPTMPEIRVPEFVENA